MKIFNVRNHDGQKVIPAEQLATFTVYIQGVQFRFVVTRLQPHLTPDVTHRNSGSRVCEVESTTIAACLNDYKAAGKRMIEKLIEKKGEARVYDVLNRAESY